MKINKAKLLVGTLAIASVAATVGSISGTVAWFQYNTRATVEYQGTTVHCTESLQVSVDGTNWKQTLGADDITDAIVGRASSVHKANELVPVTSGGLVLDKAPVDLYTNPIYQYAGVYPTTAGAGNEYWGLASKEEHYIEFPVYLRVLDVDGETTETLLEKKVYLSDVSIAAATVSGKLDVSNAVRVSIFNGATASTATAFGTYSKTGADVNTYGALDLNGDGLLDTAQKYSFETGTFNPLIYGDVQSGTAQTPVAKSHAIGSLAAGATNEGHLIANDSDPYHIIGTALGTTAKTGNNMFQIVVRIYLEGWQTLETTVDAVATSYESIDAATTAMGTTTDKFVPVQGAYYKTTGATPKVFKYNGSSLVEVTNGKDTVAVWNESEFIGAKFNVGLRFSAETHKDHA